MKKISQIGTSESTRTLGVMVTPTLSWKSQFEKLRSKVVEGMEKFINASLTHQQTAIYYNLYILSSVLWIWCYDVE